MPEISVRRGEFFAHLASPGGRSWGRCPPPALRVSPEPRLFPSPPHLLLRLLLHPWRPVKTDLPLAHERHVLILRQGALSAVTACANAGPSDHKHLSSQSTPRDSCGLEVSHREVTGIVGNSNLRKGFLVDVVISGCLPSFIVPHSIPGSLLDKQTPVLCNVGDGR